MQSQQFVIIICKLFAFCFVTRFSHCLSLAVQVMSHSGGRVNYHCDSDLVALFSGSDPVAAPKARFLLPQSVFFIFFYDV